MNEPGQMQVVAENLAFGHLRNLLPILAKDIRRIIALNAFHNDKAPAFETEGDVAIKPSLTHHNQIWIKIVDIVKLPGRYTAVEIAAKVTNRCFKHWLKFSP